MINKIIYSVVVPVYKGELPVTTNYRRVKMIIVDNLGFSDWGEYHE